MKVSEVAVVFPVWLGNVTNWNFAGWGSYYPVWYRMSLGSLPVLLVSTGLPGWLLSPAGYSKILCRFCFGEVFN